MRWRLHARSVRSRARVFQGHSGGAPILSSWPSPSLCLAGNQKDEGPRTTGDVRRLQFGLGVGDLVAPTF